jgi:hypothetical protein
VLQRRLHGRRLLQLQRAGLRWNRDVRPPRQHVLRHREPHADGNVPRGGDRHLQRRSSGVPLLVFLRLPCGRQLLRGAEWGHVRGDSGLPARRERGLVRRDHRLHRIGAAVRAIRGVHERPTLHRADVRIQLSLQVLRAAEPGSLLLHGGPHGRWARLVHINVEVGGGTGSIQFPVANVTTTN